MKNKRTIPFTPTTQIGFVNRLTILGLAENNAMDNITRKTTRRIMLGDIPIGGNAPISIQSMFLLRLQTFLKQQPKFAN
jgi:hypothetical protein